MSQLKLISSKHRPYLYQTFLRQLGEPAVQNVMLISGDIFYLKTLKFSLQGLSLTLLFCLQIIYPFKYSMNMDAKRASDDKDWINVGTR